MVDGEDLLYRLKELLNKSSARELANVFRTWINRLVAVSRGDGTYISCRIKLVEESSCFNRDIELAENLIDQTI
jgi:hypothetical protein